MKCPNCGTVLQGNVEVCPACHADLKNIHEHSDDDSKWCASCGSPVPSGSEACPVCGLPVVDSFEEVGTEIVLVSDTKKQDEPLELVSAIPPMPEDGSDPTDSPERFSRNKLMLVTIAAAVVLMGGFTLFVTKPWNPAPVVTHATEDADTSMAGFPGVVQYLRAQDLVVNDDGKEYGPRAEKRVVAYRDHLGKISSKATELEESLQAFLSNSKLDNTGELAKTAMDLRNELVTSAEEVMLLTIEDKDVLAERDRLAVLTGYLYNEVDLLSNCWHTIGTEKDRAKATTAVRKTLSDGLEGHSLDEWHKLFVNAYSSAAE